MSNGTSRKALAELEAKKQKISEKEKLLKKKEQDLVKLERDLKTEQHRLHETLENSIQEKLEKEQQRLESKEKELDDILSIAKSGDTFGNFTLLVDKIYHLYVASSGDSEGLVNSISLLIEARDNLVGIKKK